MTDSADSSGTRLVVIGAGPGGYPAAFLAADLGMDVTLIDLDFDPGGVCLYRGCIPSKALLHVARFLNEVRESSEWGLTLPAPKVDLDKMRQWKDQVVGKLTSGLGVLRRRRNVRGVQGRARFLDARTVHVDPVGEHGQPEDIPFDHAIIATGSVPVWLRGLPEQTGAKSRIIDSTGALEMRDVPETLLVVGGGYIGLELGTVYAALGSTVTVVEMTGGLLPGVDRDLVEFLARRLERRFEHIYLETKASRFEVRPDGVHVRLTGVHVEQPDQVFDKVLIAVGRRPNSADLGLDNTAVRLDPKGFILVNRQRRTDEASIFAIGDVAGQPMLAHKASYEARIAVEAISGRPSAYDPQAIPAVVFTDPEVAWTGLSENQARGDGTPFKVARFPWVASGRATTLDRNDGLTKLVLDPITERVLGVGIVGINAGELIAEGTLAVEMGARAEDLQMTIHAHPTLSETVMEAAEVFFGHSPHYMQKPDRRGRSV